jgi:luciferase family oxidoreductase group 1
LDALFPGRIDLGLGRAPGADSRIGQMLRKDLMRAAEGFPNDVVELQALFAGDPRLPLQATPGRGADVELWILGSSLYGAELAAELGMPYAFASHYAPQQMMEAIALYRARFKPSQQLARPYVMLGFNVFAADSDEEGELLATSLMQAFVALRSGNPGKLKPPVAGYADTLPLEFRAMLKSVLGSSAIGAPATVKARTEAFVERTGADELMITSQIFDHAARLQSYELLAGVFADAASVSSGVP